LSDSHRQDGKSEAYGFNNHVFKRELEDYEKEGVKVGAVIEFKDNDGIITLIGGGRRV